VEISKSFKEQQDYYLGSRCALGHAASLLSTDRIRGTHQLRSTELKMLRVCHSSVNGYCLKKPGRWLKKKSIYEYYMETFHALQLLTFKYKFCLK